MAQTSWPFHNSETGGTPVLEDSWSIMARQWASSGVVGYPNDAALQVYANSSGREVHVRSGRASVRGHWIDVDAQVTLAISANSSGNPRIDYVVVRLDPADDEVTLHIIEGTPGPSPAAPALTHTDTGVDDVPLATVTVASGALTIAGGSITDRRQYTSVPVIPCLSTRRPTNPAVGWLIIETDTGTLRRWDGSGWEITALPMSGGTISTLDVTGDLKVGEDFSMTPQWIITGTSVSPGADGGNWKLHRMSPDGTLIESVPIEIDYETGQVWARETVATDSNASVVTKGYADTKLPLAGGTVTGALTVPTPTADGHASTKAYSDAVAARFKSGVWSGTVGLSGIAVITLPVSPTGRWSVVANAEVAGGGASGYALCVIANSGGSSVGITVYVPDTFGGLAYANSGQTATIHYHATAY